MRGPRGVRTPTAIIAVSPRAGYTESVHMTTSALAHLPLTAGIQRPGGPDLQEVAGEVVRDLIRRDPALWERVQADPALRRSFGFDDDDGLR